MYSKRKLLCGLLGILEDTDESLLNLYRKSNTAFVTVYRVDIPVDSLCSDYIQSEKQRKHNNYLKIRKTAKRGYEINFGFD